MTQTLVPASQLHADGYISEVSYGGGGCLYCSTIPAEPAYATALPDLIDASDLYVGAES